MGVAPQELEGPIPFTVQDLVEMSRTAWQTQWWAPAGGSADRQAVDRALALTDLTDLRHRPLDALSGGEKQRAIVAMAIAREPPLLLLDEATSHLDMNHRLEIMQILERLNRERATTILMISHDMNLSADFCHRLLLLDHGRLVADGPPAVVLREDLLRKVYHCDVAVRHDPRRGVLTVHPARRLPSLPSGSGGRCHVIGGGGSAGELMRRLSLSGYAISCGVLNAGDTDTETAAALGIPAALEKPFSPVSPTALEAAQRLTDGCRLCMISGVPFGTGNVVNLSIAETILRQGGQVLIMAGIEDRDYTPDRSASVRVQRMLDAGAQTWENMADLMDRLLPESVHAQDACPDSL
jgi:iron complex transport system ATP-binding protein